MRAIRVLAIATLALAPACIAPSVVESSGRAVAPRAADVAWRPATNEDLRGLFESISIEGEVAASLWKVEYVFAADGTYSGAALVLGGSNPEFQTLGGTWSLAGDVLDLGDGQTARVRAADDRIELSSEAGVLVLARAEVE